MLYKKVGSKARLLNYITHDANGEDVQLREREY